MEKTPESDGFRDPTRVLLGGCGFELSLALVAILLGWLFGPDPRHLIPKAASTRAIAVGCLWGVLSALPWIAAILALTRLPWRWSRELFETSRQVMLFVQPLRTWELGALAISAGVGEEILFRGWLQMLLSGPMTEWTFTGNVIAVAIASLVFGLVHPLSRTYILFAFLMGVYMGALLIATRNLLTPIVSHAVYDFLALLILRRQLTTPSAD